jgi:hypothetical protein
VAEPCAHKSLLRGLVRPAGQRCVGPPRMAILSARHPSAQRVPHQPAAAAQLRCRCRPATDGTAEEWVHQPTHHAVEQLRAARLAQWAEPAAVRLAATERQRASGWTKRRAASVSGVAVAAAAVANVAISGFRQSSVPA